MAVTRIKGRVAFICDECEDELETDDYDHTDALNYVKSEGWAVIPNPQDERKHDGKKFLNLCPSCNEELTVE